MKALYEAQSVQDAVRLRLEHPQAQIIAGGTDVLVQMREGKRAGCRRSGGSPPSYRWRSRARPAARPPQRDWGRSRRTTYPAGPPGTNIRNAILNATGVSVNNAPMTPHVLFARFKEGGVL